MANVKISALPQVNTVLGTDVVPTVASSATSKITITGLANSLPQVSSSISASYALTASHALNVTSINTGSFITTGSNSITQNISGSLNLTGSLNHIGSVNVTGNIIGDYTIGTNVLATTDFKNFNFANAFQKAAFPYIFSDIITAQFGAGSYTFNLQPTYIGHSVLRIDGNLPAPAIKLVYDSSGTTVNTNGRGTIPYYTIISDNNSLLNNSSNVNFVSNNGRKHSLTVTGSILSKDGVSLGTDISNKHYITGSINSTGSFTQNGFVVLSQVSMSLDFANDTAAAAGGVPYGGLYRNGNTIAIRIGD